MVVLAVKVLAMWTMVSVAAGLIIAPIFARGNAARTRNPSNHSPQRGAVRIDTSIPFGSIMSATLRTAPLEEI